MASRFELEQQLRGEMQRVFPKAIGKMKKHEVEAALAAFKASSAGSAPPAAAPAKSIGRHISIADVLTSDADTILHVPEAPAKRVTAKDPAPVKAAARSANSQRIPRVKAPKIKKDTDAEETALFPAVAPHAVTRGHPVVGEDDTRASKIVRSHVPAAAAPTAARKHICNCRFCDQKGKVI